MIPQPFRTASRAVAGRTWYAWPRVAAKLAGKALILMYHRVVPTGELGTACVQPAMYVTPGTFERHLRFVRRHFQVLSLATLFAKWQQGGWKDGTRYCAITFDDGWVDNYRHAYPLLRAYGVPATIFLPTQLIGTDSWFWSDTLAYLLHHDGTAGKAWASGDPDAVIEHAKALPDAARERLIARLAEDLGIGPPQERRFVDWNEVREMSRHGITFGSHTATHAFLPRLAAEALEREVRQSLQTLARHCDAWLPILAYPNGDHSDAVVSAVRQAGYVGAVTTRGGAENGEPPDLFRLRRVGFHEDVSRSLPLLACHIGRQLS